MASPNDITVFAETNYREQCRLFGIKRDDRRRHMYVIGKTGMGKTNFLEQLIYSDIQAGNGLAILDPHGDFAEHILDFIPSHRINDTIYFNPADSHFPIAFNILEYTNPDAKHLVASGLVGVFKKIWADSWGPRLEYVLRNAILALLDYPGATLLGVLRILTDKTYRKKVIEKIKDPVVKSFWVDEYSKYPDRFQAEAIAPIQNKVGQFLANALIRNIVGQVKSSIDVRDVLDNQKILILNLSKGSIGEDTSALLGNMMVTQLQLGAMSRVDIPEEDRKDFYLYVDEFQNFATESFAGILSEARKYRLNLIIAHQYIEQLDEKVASAVFGNVGTLICFRVGATDAEMLVKEFAPYFTEEDLVNLAKWQIYLKLMIDGVASMPFSANVLPPVHVNYGNKEKIIRVTRERYAKDRASIEEKISRWASSLEAAGIEEQRMVSSQPPRRPPFRNDGPRPMPMSQPFNQASGQMPGQMSPPVPMQQPPMQSQRGPMPPAQPLMQAPSQPPAQQNPAQYQPQGQIDAGLRVNNQPSVFNQPTQSFKGSSARPRNEPSSLNERQATFNPQSQNQPAPARRSEEQVSPDQNASSVNPNKYEVVCANCGKMTSVSFPPDGQRPVFCKDCLRLVRSERARGRSPQFSGTRRPEPERAVPAQSRQTEATGTSAPQQPIREFLPRTSGPAKDSRLPSSSLPPGPAATKPAEHKENDSNGHTLKPGEAVQLG